MVIEEEVYNEFLINHTRDITELARFKKYLLTIPFYQTTMDDIIALTIQYTNISSKNKKQKLKELKYIIPLDLYLFNRLYKNKQYRQYLTESIVNFSISKKLSWITRKFSMGIESINIKEYLFKLISFAEIEKKSIFIIGGEIHQTEKFCTNLKRAYPHLLLVGKHPQFNFKKQSNFLSEAIIKSQADIVILLIDQVKALSWISKHKNKLKQSTSVFICLGNGMTHLLDQKISMIQLIGQLIRSTILHSIIIPKWIIRSYYHKIKNKLIRVNP